MAESTNEAVTQIAKTINGLWRAGEHAKACEFMASHLLLVIRNDLIRDGLTQHDAEDVVADAWAGFLRKIKEEGPGSVPNPMPYIWRAAKNRRVDHGKAASKADIPETNLETPGTDFQPGPNAKLDHYFHFGNGTSLIPVWQKTATHLVEATVEDAEVQESDAVKLVRETVKRLDPSYAEIVSLLLDYGPEQFSSQGASLLGISQINFRQRKRRAYNQFREKVLQVAQELGITWRGITDGALSEEEGQAAESPPPGEEPTGDEAE